MCGRHESAWLVLSCDVQFATSKLVGNAPIAHLHQPYVSSAKETAMGYGTFLHTV